MSIASIPFTLTSNFTAHITGNTTNVNASNLFSSEIWEGNFQKTIVIDSGVTVGAGVYTHPSSPSVQYHANYVFALYIPGFKGSIYILNKGTILGGGGRAASSPDVTLNYNKIQGEGGIAIYVDNSTVGWRGNGIFIDNQGSIYGGGGAGGLGGTGGQGYTTSSGYNAYPLCTCPVCCGKSCSDTAPCTGGTTFGNGCAEGGLRWFCPYTSYTYHDGGDGGYGGYGAGSDTGATPGGGYSGDAGGIDTNAGDGGDGGTGGTYGNNGDTGDTGDNGNYTNGSAGSSGGLAGCYLYERRPQYQPSSNVHFINQGTLGGRTVLDSEPPIAQMPPGY